LVLLFLAAEPADMMEDQLSAGLAKRFVNALLRQAGAAWPPPHV
jgi:hypothetical protein